jgi:tripartite-type tricarboxylate transporter receptor subunit TctC
MMLPRRQLSHLTGTAAVLALVFAACVTLLGHSASSQPTRLRIINPFPPGGTADVVARVLGEQIGSSRNVTVLVENRPGAGAVVGTEVASRAAPDGNTLLLTSTVFVVNPHFRKLSYDPLTSFEPICNLVQSPQVIVVNSESPYRTLADLLDAARAKPGELTLAGVGPATTSQIAFEMLKRRAGVNMTFVPYPGNAPVVNSVLGAHVTSASTNYADVAEHINAGKLRALAIPSRTRIELLPDVPTIAESGYKDFDLDVWFGLFAPANTPKQMLSQLAGWFTAAAQIPEVKAKLAVQGLYPVGICGADFAAQLRKQYDDFGRVIREANIKAE